MESGHIVLGHGKKPRWTIKRFPGGVVNLLDSHMVWQSCDMDTPPAAVTYKNHRFPMEIISHAVQLYFRFCFSFRDVEELLLERGVLVTYEAIRKWCRKFGQQYANQLRRRRPHPGDTWHMDEAFLTIKGEHHYLWWAVDQDGGCGAIHSMKTMGYLQTSCSGSQRRLPHLRSACVRRTECGNVKLAFLNLAD